MALKVIWQAEARKLLMTRDRFTRQAIEEEFRSDPQREAIPIDPEQGEFLTQVSNNRFSVIWQLDDPRQEAVVKAVVPLTNVEKTSVGLKEYVQRAVDAESKG
jgi:hypothetical protein